MKTFIAIAALAATAAFSAVPASAQMSSLKSLDVAATASGNTIVHKTRGRRGRIAAGVGLGVLGVIAASQAHAYYSDREDHHERRCRRLRNWCSDGDDRACWKYDNRC